MDVPKSCTDAGRTHLLAGDSRPLFALLRHSLSSSLSARMVHPSIAGRKRFRLRPMMVWETWRPILRELGPGPNGVCEAHHANPPDFQEPVILEQAPHSC